MTLREDALRAVKAAIRATDPESLVRQKLSLRGSRLIAGSTSIDLSRFDRTLVVGGGKASLGMVLAVERVLGGRITEGVVTIPDYLPVNVSPRRVVLKTANHPLPSKKGVAAVKRMLKMVGKPGPHDLVICLLSGGAPALLPLPAPGLALTDKQALIQLLLASGASISEVNIVRRHLSGVKGGRLAEKLYPATILTLILSDVVGDRLEDVGSGPTAPDPSTYADAQRVLEKYRLWNGASETVREAVRVGAAGRARETPKPGSEIFRRVHNLMVGSNREACNAAASALRARSYRTIVLTREMSGEARQMGWVFSSIFRGLDQGQFSLKRPLALVAAGETTVAVKGRGKGGRNQELVLAAAPGLQGLTRVLVVSVATDGVDGPTSAAGAWADETTMGRATEKGLGPESFLERNDSHSFFRRLNDLVVTGPTGTNVGDLSIVLAGRRG